MYVEMLLETEQIIKKWRMRTKLRKNQIVLVIQKTSPYKHTAHEMPMVFSITLAAPRPPLLLINDCA